MVKKTNSKEREKSTNPIITMIKTEWQYLGKNKPRHIFYMALFVISGILQLVAPWIIGKIFNSIQSGQVATQQELNNLLFLIFLIFIVELSYRVFHWIARIIQRVTAFQTHRNFANDLCEKTVELPVAWHKDNHSGNTIDRINKARASLSSFAQHDSYKLVYIIISIFGSLALIFFLNLKIGIFAIISCILILFTVTRLDKTIKKQYKKLNKFEHELSATIFDYFSNIITVITLRLREIIRTKIDKRIEIAYETHKKETFFTVSKWQVGNLAITLMTVIALAYQAYTDFHTTGIILIGTLFMLYSYLDRVGRYFFSLAEFYGAMTKKAADIESVQPIDQAYAKIKSKIKNRPPKSWNNIQIKNLNFSYNTDEGQHHMKDINLTINRGEKIALIGESGSGKSTILSLIRGLYPTSAEILVDNKKLKNGFETLKRKVTLIPQDPEIFNDTISYNITMDMFQKQNEIDKAIQMAQFSSVVKKLPKGLETNVQEKGVSLSGGEKQRLALSRGLLAAKDSDIILLDEPTSSVDSINERKIHENIFKEFKDKTILSSIHRLHLLDKFDKIVIFDQGQIVASGTYKQIQQNPTFQKIWRRYIGRKNKSS